MILPEKSVLDRLNSSDNLLQRLTRIRQKPDTKSNAAMSLFTPGKSNFASFKPEPSLPSIPPLPEPSSIVPEAEAHPTLDKLLDRPENIIGLELAHNTALSLLNRSVQMLGEKLDDVRADKLPSVIAATSKVIDGIRKEKSEMNKNKENRSVHLHFYTPIQREESEYKVIDV